MLVELDVPAIVAGVPEIAVLVPPMPGTGAVDPATLAVAHELGLTGVYRANGPAGIAALRSARPRSPASTRSLAPAARP